MKDRQNQLQTPRPEEPEGRATRRQFLTASVAGAAGAGAALAAGASAGDGPGPDATDHRQIGIAESEHVRTFYRLSRF